MNMEYEIRYYSAQPHGETGTHEVSSDFCDAEPFEIARAGIGQTMHGRTISGARVLRLRPSWAFDASLGIVGAVYTPYGERVIGETYGEKVLPC